MLIVLIFLQIITLMSINSIESYNWQLKMARDYWRRYQLSTVTNKITTELERRILSSTPTCLVTQMPGGMLAKQKLNWWQGFGCSGNFAGFHYYYVTESLGADPCYHVEGKVADFYRITVILFPSPHNLEKIILQSVVSRVSPYFQECKQVVHDISLGRQMRREL